MIVRFPVSSRIPGARRAARWLALRRWGGLEPVVVYQMAKVGSTSVVDALLRSRLPTFHVHRMNPDHIRRLQAERSDRGWGAPPPQLHERLGGQLYERVVQRGGPLKVVTLVRDPIARNLSSYFEHLDSIWRTAGAHRVVPFDELCAGFLERYTHREPLTWFDDELRPVLGLDVYAQPFPAKGSLIVASDTFDALVLKAEAPDTEKQRALAAYLGVAVAPIRPANRTAGTVKGLAYSRFVREVRLPATYVDSMLDAWYTRHFFSDAERETMREKYLPNGDAKN